MSYYQSVHIIGLAWVFCTLAKVVTAQVVPTSDQQLVYSVTAQLKVGQ